MERRNTANDIKIIVDLPKREKIKSENDGGL